MATPVDAKFLEVNGISQAGTVWRNLSKEELLEKALEYKNGVLTNTGALCCETGEFTGRSPKDKFVVKDASTEADIAWGPVNQPMTPESYAELRKDQLEYMKGKELFVLDAVGGQDESLSVPIRVINESPWANLFCRHLFVRVSPEKGEKQLPQFTIFHTPGFKSNPAKHGTRCENFVVINFSEGTILIGGTRYAGEMKKSIFSILNYLYPKQGTLAMHCSANIDKEDKENVALFFGLSGTGKTTLSADPKRLLVGDDEHGWSDNGVFNFEGGCYAKCIDLTEEKEPQIFGAIRDGAILENVVLDDNKTPDYKDISLTENTRAAYPLDHIEGAVSPAVAGHPKNIILLTCDAFGVMPPISKLSPDQAMYHFLSGYTAKVAGTEKGMGSSPQATFSACFGEPFLPLPPVKYAEMLGQKMREHNTNCWLVNTGWVGGKYGEGSRIKLSYTRAMVTAALNGKLNNVAFDADPIFGLEIPSNVEGVPSEVLSPRELWKDKESYDTAAKDLANMFVENFKRFSSERPEIAGAGGPAVSAAA